MVGIPPRVGGGLEGGALVDPADGHPLGLGAQVLHGLPQPPEGALQVVVGQAEVEVMAVTPLDSAALLHRPPGVGLLPRTNPASVSPSLPVSVPPATPALPREGTHRELLSGHAALQCRPVHGPQHFGTGGFDEDHIWNEFSRSQHLHCLGGRGWH